MDSPPTSRRGVETIRRYGADFIARRARDGLIAKALARDGLDPTTMKPDDLAAYRLQVMRKQVDLMRAAKAAKRAARATATEPPTGGGS